MKQAEQAGTGKARGRHVGLYLAPEDYERLRRWSQRNNRSMANAAETIIMERVSTDELADKTELADQAEQREYERAERLGGEW